jgi:cytochrome c553
MNRLILIVLASLVALPAFARGDAAAGEKKAQEACAACHGPDGSTPLAPDYPKLGGQHYDYLVKALRDYKSGARKNPIMAGQAQALTLVEIENLAAYFASRPGSLAYKR